MGNEIYRRKSIDAIQSPDNLKEYIRVINPSLWIVFIAAFLLLAGAFVWGTAGRIEEKLPVTAVAENGTAVCDYAEGIGNGMKAVLGSLEGTVSSVSPSGAVLEFATDIPDGVYSGYIVLDEISPISFIFN